MAKLRKHKCGLICYGILFLFFTVPGIELSILCLQGRHSARTKNPAWEFYYLKTSPNTHENKIILGMMHLYSQHLGSRQDC